jgi:imidazolonepropionase-like amidohydrolase
VRRRSAQRRQGFGAALGLLATLAFALAVAPASMQTAAVIVLDRVRVIDGTGAAPRDDMRVVVRGDRIEAVEPAGGPAPQGSEVIDLAGHTVMPGLIDLHYHIEDDPKLALRQLANGVTSFRDPGQWIGKFDGLKQIIRDEGLTGPRMSLDGPHIDGERPAYPSDSVVARDPVEARRAAERNIAEGATSIKIYFRLPFASASEVVRVCHERRVPCTAHLEIVDARDLLDVGLDGIEHITSFGTAILPRHEAERYRQRVLADNDARRDGRYEIFASADLDGTEARRLYAVLERTRPFVNATLAVFEVRKGTPREGAKTAPAVDLRGFEAMKRLTAEAFRHGARLTLGGHTGVPFAGRGEAPWREMELMVDAGLTPLEAIAAATSVGAASFGRPADLGRVTPGALADLAVLSRDPSKDITAVRTVTRVMMGGRFIDRVKYAGW